MTGKSSAKNPPLEVKSFSAENDPVEKFNRRERVRLRIIKIALSMFSKRGFRAVTVGDIADAAGMSDRTFFRYFDTKEDVLFFWTEWQRAVISEALMQEREETCPIFAFRRSFCYLAELNEKNKDAARELVGLILRTPELRNRYHVEHLLWREDIAAALIGDREIDDEQRFVIDNQASAAIGIYLSVIQSWACGEMSSVALPALIGRAFDTLETKVF